MKKELIEAIAAGDIPKLKKIRQQDKPVVSVIQNKNPDTFTVEYRTPEGMVKREGVGRYTPIGDEIGRMIIKISVRDDGK